MKIPIIEQHDSSDCGTACIASICEYYGKEVSMMKLRELLGTDINGTTIASILRTMEKMGFKCAAVRTDKDSLESDYSLPAIAHLVKKDGTSHYVTIYSVNKGKIRYMDPAEEHVQKKTIDDFINDFDGILILAVPDEGFEKGEKGARSVFSSFTSMLRPHKKLFIVAIAASIMLTLFGIAISLFNKVLIDEIIPYSEDRQLVLFAIALTMVIVTQTILGSLRTHVVLYLSQKIDIPLMLGYFEHIFRLPMNFFSSRKTGDIVTRFQDAGVIKDILTNTALTVIIDVAMVAIVGCVLCAMNAKLFILVLAVAGISAILIFTFRKPYRKLNKKSMEQNARLNSQIIESINGVETIKTNSCEDLVMEKIETEYIKAMRIAFKGNVLTNIQGSISSFTGHMCNLGFLVLGGFMVINGETTLGTLIAFTSLSSYFIDPINRLINLQLSIQEADVSLKRLAEIYDTEEEEDLEEGKDASIIAEGIEEVSVKDLTFSYGNRAPVLNDLSMTIPRGKKVAIVGRSGSGKTTLSKLLLKFYLSDKGLISYNGTDIKDIDAFALRERIGCVPQNVELFSGTIRDNLLMVKRDSTPGELASACKLAGCDDFINRLPAGLDTFLDENGGGLSGGERQRLSVARVLLKDPDFIILDEATSNMDFITEKKIYDVIFDRMKNKTMMIIAHRLSTIRRCDMIYVMDNGMIAESGTHSELLAINGLYTELWNSQMGETAPVSTVMKPDIKEEGGDVIEYA